MKTMRTNIICSVLICLWSFSCLAMNNVNKQLRDAVLGSKIDKVRQAIDGGAEVNLQDSASHATVLDRAIERLSYAITNNFPKRYNALKILVLLIEKGAHINGLGNWDWTPLRNAMSPNEPELLVIELLLSYGADPAGKSTDGKTALSMAQKNLASSQSERRATRATGPWLRYGPYLENDHNAMKFLLSRFDYKINADDHDRVYETVLSAKKEHAVQVLDLLTSYPALLQKVKTQPSRKLLHECIEKGRFTLVKLLLQCGVTATEADYLLAHKKYNEKQSMAYEIIGKLLKERLTTTTKFGLISKRGIIGANEISHDGNYLELTHDIAEHIGSLLSVQEQ